MYVSNRKVVICMMMFLRVRYLWSMKAFVPAFFYQTDAKFFVAPVGLMTTLVLCCRSDMVGLFQWKWKQHGTLFPQKALLSSFHCMAQLDWTFCTR